MPNEDPHRLIRLERLFQYAISLGVIVLFWALVLWLVGILLRSAGYVQ